MPLHKGQRNGGIYELEDMRLRSRIEPECGCWRWGMRCNQFGTAMVTMLVNGKKKDMSGRRAALILFGVNPRPGQEALQKDECLHADCVNPRHAYFGTRKQRNEMLGARGAWSDPTQYAHITAYARTVRKLDDEQRLEVACSSETGAALARRLGVSESLIGQIRRGYRKTPAMSVFEWRG